MEAAVLSQREVYREVNAVTGTARCVIFGSGMLSELPVAELVRDLGLNISVCNRSVESAALRDAFELMDECVCALRPEKLFLGFGETDISRADFDAERFFADYARLIAEISARCACGIYLIPLLCESERARALNARIARLARACGCECVNISGVVGHEKPILRLFGELTRYMRGVPAAPARASSARIEEIAPGA